MQTIQKRLYKEQNCDIPGFSKGISVANAFSSLRVTYSCFLLQKQRRDIQKFSSSKVSFLVFYSKTVFSFILVSNTIEGLLFWKSIHCLAYSYFEDISFYIPYKSGCRFSKMTGKQKEQRRIPGRPSVNEPTSSICSRFAKEYERRLVFFFSSLLLFICF